jgi:hypothetical protein
MRKLGIAYTFVLFSIGSGCATAPAPISVFTTKPSGSGKQTAQNRPNAPQPCPLVLTPTQPGQARTGHFVVRELAHDNGSRRAVVDCGQGVTLTQPTWCAPHLSPDVVLSTPDGSPFVVFEKYPPGNQEWTIRVEGKLPLVEIEFGCTGARISYIHHPIPLRGIADSMPFLR